MSKQVVGRTLLYALIINLIILILVDSRECGLPPCDPYVFYWIISLILGLAIVYIHKNYLE